MNCPNCSKELTLMHDPRYVFCAAKQYVERYGEMYNRKIRWVKDATSGCGALFEFPLSEEEQIREWDTIYRKDAEKRLNKEEELLKDFSSCGGIRK